MVARGIWAALASGRRGFLDARRAVGDAFPERFPTVFEACRARGLDPRRQPIPVAPAAHYHMGGVATDLEGRTSVAGLWAAGEVACTGVHGANRLASNSLLEALVFGARVASSLAEALPHLRRSAVPFGIDIPDGAGSGDAVELTASLRQLMWDEVGLVRTARGLGRALTALERLKSALPAGAFEVLNMVTVARLLALAAVARPESRGAHFRADHPITNPAWRRRQLLEPLAGEVRLTSEEVAAEPAAAAAAWA